MKEESIPNRKYSIKTFGCKVNTYDSSLIQNNLDEKSWTEQALKDSEEAVHVVNTCAVTEEAVKEAQRWIRRYRKNHPTKPYSGNRLCSSSGNRKIFFFKRSGSSSGKFS